MGDGSLTSVRRKIATITTTGHERQAQQHVTGSSPQYDPVVAVVPMIATTMTR
jgi:hypothetical protein